MNPPIPACRQKDSTGEGRKQLKKFSISRSGEHEIELLHAGASWFEAHQTLSQETVSLRREGSIKNASGLSHSEVVVNFLARMSSFVAQMTTYVARDNYLSLVGPEGLEPPTRPL